MTKLKVQYKSERVLKRLLSHAIHQADHYKEYGFITDTKYWQAKVIDYKAQLYALYYEKEEFDKINTI
tara:strand:+ start:213 stop:416 length:204 start_codon:yes stop_codon:yes gene_type:complete